MGRLVEKGFVTAYKCSEDKVYKYNLNSFYKVWNLLDFRFKERRCDTYRYTTIPNDILKSKESIKAYITSVEIQKNQDNQKYITSIPIQRKIDYHEKTLKKTTSNKIKVRKQNKILELKQELLKRSSACSPSDNNLFNRISCNGVSSILGYKTSMTGYNLEISAEKKGFLSIHREKTLIASNISLFDFRFNKLDYKNCFWKFGRVYRRQCNRLTPLLTNKKKESDSLNNELLLNQIR